jgi:hypothetical protein
MSYRDLITESTSDTLSRLPISRPCDFGGEQSCHRGLLINPGCHPAPKIGNPLEGPDEKARSVVTNLTIT